MTENETTGTRPIDAVLDRARLVEQRGGTRHAPAGMRKVHGHDYDRAVQNAVRLTGFDHDQAERLVCSVLAPFLLAPSTPQPEPREPGSDLWVLNSCNWMLVRGTGEPVYCDLGDGEEDDDQHTGDGQHAFKDGHDRPVVAWSETDPRAIHLPTWKGREA